MNVFLVTFIAASLTFAALPSYAVNVTFVACMSYTSLAYSYDYYGPVIDMAIEELDKKYPFDFKLVNLSPKSCSVALKYISDLARDLNMPVISSGGSAEYLSDRERFPTLLRLLPYQQNDLVLTMSMFLRRYGWKDVALLCDLTEVLGNFFKLACEGYRANITVLNNGTTLRYFPFNTGELRERERVAAYSRWLRESARASRVILIVAHGKVVREVMLVAKTLGMTHGDFVFVTTYPMEHPLYGYCRWQFYDGHDEDAREAFKSLFFISTPSMRSSSANFPRFELKVKLRSFEQTGLLYEEAEEVSSFTTLQYTLMHLITQLINETRSEGLPLNNNGAEIVKHSFAERKVESVAGNFEMANGDRKSYVYLIKTMDHKIGNFYDAFRYDTAQDTDLVEVRPIEWAYRDTPPLNIPLCGFDGLDSQCSSNKSIVNAIIGTVSGFIVVLGVVGFLIARHTNKKTEQEDPRWYVPLSDIEEPHSHTGLSVTSSRPGLLASSSKLKTSGSIKSPSTASASRKSPHLVKYRDNDVWGTRIKLTHKFSPTKSLESLIKKMKRLQHANLARFFGMCPHELQMIILTEYCPRGSLTDVINNENVKFDASLKTSLVLDLTKALVFLHDSPIEYHGNLAAQTCLLDSRFILKLASYRLDFLPRVPPDFLDGEEDYRRFLTHPPERLRGPIADIYRGTKEGDIYSFAFILAQILIGAEPFEAELSAKNLSAKDIYDKLVEESFFPFRPKLSTDTVSSSLMLLIERCWDDKPSNRPSMKLIERYLKAVPGFEKDQNFVDFLFQRLMGYAEELENRINQATAGMIEEKKRSEELLFQVLPKHLATALTQGHKIEPEGFDSVTIGFTGIANFFLIALQSTPWEIVAFLNDLYSMFDATLELFDVYKVETISDSYMIVSGLPVRNGSEHSRQIAKLSLELMKEAGGFQIKHRPGDKLELKIGFHTGKCAAGIVGLKLPRYCLFGDTINMASRMCSTGIAHKIQLSMQAKLALQQFPEFRYEFRGMVDVKGKGSVKCYWLLQDDDNVVERKDSH